MLVAVCSDKGSPGTTTTALALAAAWPAPAVLVEADPFGGDLPVRLRTQTGAALPETPTVLTVATAARTTSPDRLGELVVRYAHRINDQLMVVPGHLVSEQAGGVPDWAPLAAALTACPLPVVVDLGRVHAASPLLPVAAAADVGVVVGHGTTASVIRLRERLCRLVPALASHSGVPPRLWPVVVTPARHGVGHVDDVRRVLAETAAGPMVAGAGYLAVDARGVARLEAGESPTGRAGRTPLMRTARRVTGDLSQLGARPSQRPGSQTPDSAGAEARGVRDD